MKKELKYLLLISLPLIVFGAVVNFYFSDQNKKNFFRYQNTIDKRLEEYKNDLKVLENDTKNIIEYIEENDDNKKEFNFWKLLD